MLRRFGWFYWVLGLGRALGQVRLDDHSAERIRQAAARGPIVYVLLRRSTLDHLALNTVLNQRRLPLSVWANGVTSFFWQPVADAWRDVAQRLRRRFQSGPTPDAITSGWLTRSVAEGLPVTVFLQEGGGLADWLLPEASDPLDAILLAQRQPELVPSMAARPIQMLPIVVVWNRRPNRGGGDAVRAFVEGIADAPGFFAQLLQVLFRTQDAFVQIGEPVDLAEFAERVEPLRRSKALRTVLRRYLHRESSVVRGPRLLPQRVMKRIVLDNPPMRELARREAEATGKSVERVQRQMERDFDKIAAHFRFWVIRLSDLVLKPLWTRIYAGVDVRPEDIERVRAATRQGTVVLVPSHKSHFDYLLLSWVLYDKGLALPHVVAGMNLAIWPISIFLRGAGGFFIKRSFTGDRIFPAVFARYLRELVRQNYPIEFFIEGGRTRSGKLLPPKLGVLGMIFDAAAVRRTGQEVTLLPVALAYEEVAEEQAYARELGGETKTAESVGELVKARQVLWRRYGRVYMRVGEPIPCGPVVDSAGHLTWHDRPRSDQKEVLQRMGERVIHRIGRVTVLLPTSLLALALLAHHRRGIRHLELLQRVERFRAFLARQDALEAASLTHLSQAVHEALGRFHRAKLIESVDHPSDRVWAPVVDKRITLDFHKNQVLHFFAPAMYASAAVRALPDGPFATGQAAGDFVFLTWFLRRELILDPDRPATLQLADGLDALLAHGALAQEEDGRWRVVDPGRMGEIHALGRSSIEGYLLALGALPSLVIRGIAEAEMPRALQREAEAGQHGPVGRPESLSLVTLQNAFATIADEGLIQRPADAERYAARLRPMVG